MDDGNLTHLMKTQKNTTTFVVEYFFPDRSTMSVLQMEGLDGCHVARKEEKPVEKEKEEEPPNTGWNDCDISSDQKKPLYTAIVYEDKTSFSMSWRVWRNLYIPSFTSKNDMKTRYRVGFKTACRVGKSRDFPILWDWLLRMFFVSTVEVVNETSVESKETSIPP